MAAYNGNLNLGSGLGAASRPLPPMTQGQEATGQIIGLDNGPLTADRARFLMTEAQSDIEDIVATIRGIVDVKIEEAASHNMGFIYFTVPKNLYQFGMYNVDVVGQRLAVDLNKSGFSVYGIPENLKIAWSRDAILKSNPKKIRQKFLNAKKQAGEKYIEVDDTNGKAAIILPRKRTTLQPGATSNATSNAAASSAPQNGGMTITIPQVKKR